MMSEITIRRPIHWRSAQGLDVGKVREINEDSILALPEQQLWAVADGMGGYEAGNVASDMVVKSLESLEKPATLNEWVDLIEDRLIDVNHRILSYADIMLQGRTLGSTVIILSIQGTIGVCLWAGDSRLYRYRHKQLVQLSRDHSPIAEKIQQGYLTEEDAKNHPDSNVVTRAIGADPYIYIDINVFRVQLGDLFLLCSDGLYNMVSKDEIIDAIDNNPIDQAIGVLLQKALDNGADDNISVVLVKGESTPSQIL